MAQLIVIVCGLLALLGLAGAAGALALGDRDFQARLTARVAPVRGAERRGGGAGGLDPLLSALGRWGETAGRGAVEGKQRGELRVRLIQAGFYADRAVEIFFGIRAVAAVALGLTGLLLAPLLHLKGLLPVAGSVMVGANLGLFAPNLLLNHRIAERRTALHYALPDAIDLMVVSLEAGATLSAALQRVVAEFGDLHPIISEQFGLMLLEMQAGASRAEALNRLALRAPSDELRSLTTMIVQSDAVGASLGGTLRVFAEELRSARYLEAERKAAELPVKIAFPLVLCIFPCLASVIFIPVAIRIVRTFLHG